MNLQDKINNSKYIVFMTGAGISTPSGIPDYRSKNGLYTNNELKTPEYLLSSENLRLHPQDFYKFVTQNMYFPEAKPNIIHQKIAEITNQKGMVITQNVDKLHKVAGTRNVLEFHGNLYDIYCQKCGKYIDYKQYLQSYIHQEDGGVFRPNIVLYGEGINNQILQQSVRAIERADLIVIVGTSFKVYPFAGLLEYKNMNAQVVAINKEDLSNTSGIETIVADAVDVFTEIKL